MNKEHHVVSPITIFYSYAREDEILRSKLNKHLSSLRRQGLITEWYDRQIVPGTNWSEAIDHYLNEASVILLLVSPDFLASDYCYGVEMQRALERHLAGEAYVIPILLRPVEWKDAPFAHLQCLPKSAKPVTEWENQDAGFRDIAQGIRTVVEEILDRLTSDLFTEKHKQKRTYEIFQTAYQDWISFGEKEYQLLSRDTLEIILQYLANYKLPLPLLKYLFCSIAFLSTWEGLEINKLGALLRAIDFSDILNLSHYLLQHPNARIKIGFAELIPQLTELHISDILIKQLEIEKASRVKRAFMRSIYRLGKRLPDELARFIVENDSDWLLQSYALLSLRGYRACLLVSDGTDFASELGMLARNAGFKVITLSEYLPLLKMGEVEDEIFKAYELMLLVRGEHYSQSMFGNFYRKIKRFVSDGGSVFATSWTSWETRNLGSFDEVLPFQHLKGGFAEDITIICQVTESELAQKVYFTKTTYNASFEILQNKEHSTILLQSDDGIPIFGYHQYGSGFCYYLNTCQHSCLSKMQSPLQASADLSSFLQAVFEWIYSTGRSFQYPSP